jgi:hypothetical protein
MKRFLVTAVLLLLASSNAYAQVRPGASELNLNANIAAVSPEGGDTETVIQLQARYGYFINTALQLGVQASAVKFEDIDTFGDVGVFGAWHFGAPGSMAVPFVGAQVGTEFGMADDFGSENGIMFGGFAGLKYFLGPAGAITPELFVVRRSGDDGDWTSYGLRVGVSVFFGGR